MDARYVVVGIILCMYPAYGTYDTSSLERIENVIPVAIIGSGPAGLAAALYTVRGGMPTTIFAGPKPGGQLTESNRVENLLGFESLSGIEVMKRKRDHVVQLGARFVQGSITHVDFSVLPFKLHVDNGDTVSALSVIIATGSFPRFLNIPGEAEFLGNGVSTCAVCDAPFFEDSDVIVVGGGDTAIETVLFLRAYARSITVLNRSGALRAAPLLHKHLTDDKVLVLMHKRVVEVRGEDSVTHLMIEDTQTGEHSPTPAQGMFLAIGHMPNSDLFKGILELSSDGHVVVTGKSQQTSVCGVFAAGEVIDPVYRQAIVAEGDGAKAGLDALSFLHDRGITQAVIEHLQLYTESAETD